MPASSRGNRALRVPPLRVCIFAVWQVRSPWIHRQLPSFAVAIVAMIWHPVPGLLPQKHLTFNFPPYPRWHHSPLFAVLTRR